MAVAIQKNLLAFRCEQSRRLGVRVANQPTFPRRHGAAVFMRDQEVQDVVDSWIADRTLSRRKRAFLQTVVDQFLEFGCDSPDVASDFDCGEVDLPDGHWYGIQVVASILDALDSVSESPWPSRLDQVTADLMDSGHLNHLDAD